MSGAGEMNGFLKLSATGSQKTDQNKRSAGEKMVRIDKDSGNKNQQRLRIDIARQIVAPGLQAIKLKAKTCLFPAYKY